jgi:hypothetical protein
LKRIGETGVASMVSAWCLAGLDLRRRLRHHRGDEHSHQLSYN